MRRIFLVAALAIGALTGAASARQIVRLVVPIEITNVPADIQRARVHCRVSSADTYDYAHQIGDGETEFAIEGGVYSGHIAVEAPVGGGDPVGAARDATADAHSYSCDLTLIYPCTSRYSATGLCEHRVNGDYSSATIDPAAAALYASDPARAPVAPITGRIDRAHAATLPRHF